MATGGERLRGHRTVQTLTAHARRMAVFSGRYATAHRRALPSFVIVGAQRGGTTSLYQWLSAHPDVDPALKKEVHYFDEYYSYGMRWYRAHFPIRRDGRITGEASPYMLYHPLAPTRAAGDLPPSTKFIVQLRDPTERAISHYWLWRKYSVYETEPIERAFELEPSRLAAATPDVLRGQRSEAHKAFSYVARGEYAPQLRRWFDAVGRDRILVVESEDLYRGGPSTQRVLDWIGLGPHHDPYPTVHGAARLDPDQEELVARLRRHFEPHNQELFELLGHELWQGTGGSTG